MRILSATFGAFMSSTRYPAIIFLIVILVSLALPVFYYSHLPETIASHFNFTNAADGWMSKKSFLIIQIATIVLLSGMFFLIAHFIPRLPNSIRALLKTIVFNKLTQRTRRIHRVRR